MRLTKTLAILGAAALLLGVVACGGGKYGDVKNSMEKMASAMESFTKDMEKASSGKEVAKAMTNFAEEMKDLAPKLKDLEKKYPELKDLKDAKSAPAELQPVIKRIEEITAKLSGVMMKTTQYMGDADVQAAMQKFMEVAGQMK